MSVLSALVTALAVAGSAADRESWPQFRGSDGQGHAPGAKLALTWSESEHIRWKAADPGEGWSSPVVGDGRVWITTAREGGHSLCAVCFDLENGKLLKYVQVFRADALKAVNPMNSYASPSPILAAGKLYVHFGTYGTACLDAGTGAILWQRQDLTLDHEVGPGSSPALWHNRLIIPCDGKDVQYVTALDASTGASVWKTERSFGGQARPYPPWSSGTPLVVTVDGQDQAVIPGAGAVSAYDPENGKELWSVKYVGWSVVPRPLYDRGTVYFCTGYDKASLLAVRPKRQGSAWVGEVAWRLEKNVPNIPSPVLAGDRLFMADDHGTAVCLDAATGREVWSHRLGGTVCASLLNAAGRIYCFDNKGMTSVLAAADEFKILATNRLDSGCMASAAVAGNAMIVRTRKSLYRIED